MERSNYLNDRNILWVIYLMYMVGIVGHLINPVRYYMLLLTPFTLFFLGILVVQTSIKNYKFIVWLLLTYTTTLILEIIGVKTGVIFGHYSYGDVLGVKFLDAPVVIGLNWVIVIWGGILISEKLTQGSIYVALSTASIALIFDIILEPVAIIFGYWNWVDITVPFMNYIAWFLIAFIFSYFYQKMEIKTNTVVPIHYLLIQFVFFLTLNVVMSWV